MSHFGESNGWGILAFTLPELAIAIPSTVLAVWGLSTWKESKSAAETPKITGPLVTPVALTDGERKYLGRWDLGGDGEREGP